MNIHLCDKECLEYGAPRRLYLNFSIGSLCIGEKSQVWLPRMGYTGHWFWIAWHPRRRR